MVYEYDVGKEMRGLSGSSDGRARIYWVEVDRYTLATTTIQLLPVHTTAHAFSCISSGFYRDVVQNIGRYASQLAGVGIQPRSKSNVMCRQQIQD
jgi:hypothetical protein